jgi:hypothetical protein
MIMKSFPNAGNFNLRGKKTHDLDCGCCTINNLRDEILSKIHDKEMSDVDCAEDNIDYHIMNDSEQ